MVHIQAGTRPHRSSGAARRLTVRVLKWVRQLTDPASIGTLLALIGAWLSHTGPAWIAGADAGKVLLYAVAVLGTANTVDLAAKEIINLIDPDRRDGDIAYGIAKSLAQLRADIDNGADVDDVLDSLRASSLVPELLSTLRALAAEYLGRGDEGDEDENQRLLAAVLHLRKADKTIGYGHDEIAAIDGGDK
ncbi:hypothetical protein [Streptomyces sp. NBC_01361]|uniref:hypothetical protein n=1 Tax=Streptomyces sp. NBC_01361 TaxID=2903838 RepID=UPI002E32459C|nr:hypothetical protein [Streptomyces sp. NBC_01361]